MDNITYQYAVATIITSNLTPFCFRKKLYSLRITRPKKKNRSGTDGEDLRGWLTHIQLENSCQSHICERMFLP